MWLPDYLQTIAFCLQSTLKFIALLWTKTESYNEGQVLQLRHVYKQITFWEYSFFFGKTLPKVKDHKQYVHVYRVIFKQISNIYIQD